MRKRIFIIFVSYMWLKTLLGVTFSPFYEVRTIARRPVLFPVIFSPFLTLILLFFLGRISAYIIHVNGALRTLVAIILGGAFISIMLWQLLLIYLLLSFLTSKWRNS